MNGLKIPSKRRSETDLNATRRAAEKKARRDDVRELEIMNMEQVALFLGVSKETVRKIVAEEGLPHRRVGERWLFGRRAIVAWVNGEK